MASATDVDVGLLDSEESCIEFFPGFLDFLEVEIRKRFFYTLHGIKQRKVDNPIKECRKMIIELNPIWNNNPSTHFILLRELARVLNIIGDHNGALEFAKEQIVEGPQWNPKNYWTYLLLGQLYEEMGNYAEAIKVHENAVKATAKKEVLKKAVATLKIAADVWHHISPVSAFHHQKVAMNLLKKVEAGLDLLQDPISEAAVLFVNAYKTLAYLFKLQGKSYLAMNCSKKVLQIVNLSSPRAIVQASKIHAALAESLISNRKNNLAETHIAEVNMLIAEIVERHTYMKNHPDALIHVISKSAFCLERLGNFQESLKLRLQILEITKTYLGETHPELARTSSTVAWLHYKMGNMKDMDEYIEITENNLEDCGFETDVTKKKLFVRELSDALKNLGRVFLKLSFYARAEVQYQRGIDLNEKVYGENHQRTAHVIRGLAILYAAWKKFDQAEEQFHKCLRIQNAYRPKSNNIILKLNDELINLEEAKRKERKQRY